MNNEKRKTLELISHELNAHDKVSCEIVNQPKQMATIFRYQSENCKEKSSRGTIFGEGDGRQYPTIKVKNLSDEVLRISMKLFLSRGKEGKMKHPNALIDLNGSNELGVYHEIMILPPNEAKTHSIKCSIQIAVKNVFKQELLERIVKNRNLCEKINEKQEVHIEEVYSFLTTQFERQQCPEKECNSGHNNVTSACKKKYEKEVTKLMTEINLHKCHLNIQLSYESVDVGKSTHEEIMPVISKAIYDERHYRKLKLEEISFKSCPIDGGGRHLWILGSYNLPPKDFDVQFYEKEANNKVKIFKEKADIIQNKQVLKVKIPEYPNVNIKEKKKVFIRLVRSLDDDDIEISNSIEFEYKPAGPLNRKRKSTEEISSLATTGDNEKINNLIKQSADPKWSQQQIDTTNHVQHQTLTQFCQNDDLLQKLIRDVPSTTQSQNHSQLPFAVPQTTAHSNHCLQQISAQNAVSISQNQNHSQLPFSVPQTTAQSNQQDFQQISVQNAVSTSQNQNHSQLPFSVPQTTTQSNHWLQQISIQNEVSTSQNQNHSQLPFSVPQTTAQSNQQDIQPIYMEQCGYIGTGSDLLKEFCY